MGVLKIHLVLFRTLTFRISMSPKKMHLETKTWALSLLIATQVLLVDTHTHTFKYLHTYIHICKITC